ncbi:MAG: DUF5686 and carboxypeptidase regulatory-like domain-containing protein [Bacteroidetes bacterium]|nr:DUF5686 and carboxypeptidase regulatory-like domain-containing protein [Bacteroidota bacterium]MBU1115925.1 DUF5686 and carboxypeptidase regulatory-like domain-containing protein [Bacteroidota bacterium]MBU1798478.1 DUF5686 and carboxypeptidase regulatory-like domain-containing protein [Bacteroidota bacterium]
MKYVFACLILLIIASNINSQNRISGKISNSETKIPLPNANIYIKDSYIGTVSNINGEYSLKISQSPATLIVSYIGYKTEQVEIENKDSLQIDITLQPILLDVGSVVVIASAEDPAIAIMKKVIENKIRWRSKLSSFSAKAYTRSLVENDTSIVSLSESVSNLFWDKSVGTREEFLGKKSPNQMSYLTDMNVGSKNIINFYDDNISLLNFEFVGPTHPNALDYYDFKLKGETKLDDKIVFEIEVIPESKIQPLFSGKILVLDKEFALLNVDLKNSGNFSFATMLEEFRGSYKQQFSNYGKDFWLPIDSRTEETFVLDMGIFAFPKAIIKKNSRISHYEINVDVSDNIELIDSLKKKSKSKKQNISNGKHFDNFEKIPLTENEIQLYNNPDTAKTLIKSFMPTGIMAPLLISKEYELEKSLREDGGYEPIPLSNDYGFNLWYNRVAGLNLGGNYKYNLFKNFEIGLSAGYETFSKNFYYGSNLKFYTNEQENSFLLIGYYDKTDTRYTSQNYSQLITSLLPLFGERDYFDYYSSKQLSISYNHRLSKMSELSVEFISEDNSSINKVSNSDIFRQGFLQRINPTIDEGRLNSIKFKLTLDEVLGVPEIEKAFNYTLTDKIEFQVEHSSSKILNSDFDFTQFKLIADYTFNTFFQRRPDCNFLRVRAEASTFIGELPMQRFEIIDGSIFGYSPFAIFRSLRNKPLEGERKLALFWEYNFQSIPFELMGLTYFAQNKYEVILHGTSGRTWINANKLKIVTQNYSPVYIDEFANELGLSLRLKYTFVAVKLDITQNLSDNNTYFGFSVNLLSLSF